MSEEMLAEAPADQTIMLVEDDDDDVFLLTRSLKKQFSSAKVEVTRNGREALDYLSQFTSLQDEGCPSLVMLDLNMPFLDGHGLLLAMRRDEVLRGLPVIVLTGVETEEAIQRAYHDGASAVVYKPQTVEDMTRVIDSIVDFWFHTAQPAGKNTVHV